MTNLHSGFFLGRVLYTVSLNDEIHFAYAIAEEFRHDKNTVELSECSSPESGGFIFMENVNISRIQ